MLVALTDFFRATLVYRLVVVFFIIFIVRNRIWEAHPSHSGGLRSMEGLIPPLTREELSLAICVKCHRVLL